MIKQITLRLEEPLYDAVRGMAAEQGTLFNGLVSAILQYVIKTAPTLGEFPSGVPVEDITFALNAIQAERVFGFCAKARGVVAVDVYEGQMPAKIHFSWSDGTGLLCSLGVYGTLPECRHGGGVFRFAAPCRALCAALAESESDCTFTVMHDRRSKWLVVNTGERVSLIPLSNAATPTQANDIRLDV